MNVRLQLIVLAVLFSGSFIKAAAPTTAASQPAGVLERQREREWHQKYVVDAYEKVGKHDPKWDPAVRTTMTAWARMRSAWITPTRDEDDIIRVATVTIRESNCEDPLALYIASRGMEYWNRKQEDITDVATRAADRMRNSKYHPVFKCYALFRLAQHKTRSRENVTESIQAARALMDEAVAVVPAIAEDPSVPRRVIFDLFASLGDASKEVAGDREKYAEPAFEALKDKCKDKSLVLATMGNYHKSYAWDARGKGFAEKVSDAQFQLMAERLEPAASSCEKAFQIDPGNVLASRVMLTVELGQDQGRERMEKWFTRAMTADPDNYDACIAKLYYLEPKWHGSEKDMIAFGRQCHSKGNWDACIPMILVEAHLDASRYTEDGYQPKPQPDYFRKNAAAWNDVKKVYEEYLRRFPDSMFHRTRYAHIACWAGQWQEADRQFKHMGDKFSYVYFRNRTAYRSARAELANHLPSSSLPKESKESKEKDE